VFPTPEKPIFDFIAATEAAAGITTAAAAGGESSSHTPSGAALGFREQVLNGCSSLTAS